MTIKLKFGAIRRIKIEIKIIWHVNNAKTQIEWNKNVKFSLKQIKVQLKYI